MCNRSFSISMQRGVLFSLCLCGCLFFVFLRSSVALAKTTPSSTPTPVPIQAKTSESVTSLSSLGTINWTEPPIVAAFIVLAGEGVGFLLKCILEKSAVWSENASVHGKPQKGIKQREPQENENCTICARECDERLHKEPAMNTLATIGEHDSSTRPLTLLPDDSVVVEMKCSVQRSVALVFGSLVNTDNVPALFRLLADQQLDESVRRGIIEALAQRIVEPQDLALLAEHISTSSELSDDVHTAL